MSWFPQINFGAASQVGQVSGAGKAADKGAVNKSSSLLGAGGPVDSFQASNPLGVQSSPPSSAASLINAVSKMDVGAAKAQLSPNVQEGLAVFGSAAPAKKSTPENTDVRSLVSDIGKLSLEEASGKLNPGTLYGLQAFGALG